jgi:hypothetical protein
VFIGLMFTAVTIPEYGRLAQFVLDNRRLFESHP